MAAAATESSSFQENESVVILECKQNQNLIIDLTPNKYEKIMRPMIKCLQCSVLRTALTETATVPKVFLSQAYTSAVYDKAKEIINFTVGVKKTSISKIRFGKLLGFNRIGAVDPENIKPGHIQEMFFQMGYNNDISTLSKFRKTFLPPMWNGLFTLLFKAFSERVTGTDSASKLFYSLIYGLYTGEDVDHTSVLWTLFVQSLSSTTKHTEISMARFWAIVVNGVINHFNIPIPDDAEKAEISVFNITNFTITNPKDFSFIGSLSDSMIHRCPGDSVTITNYLKLPHSGFRAIPESLKKAFDAPVKRQKRKPTGPPIVPEGGPSKVKKKKPAVVQTSSEDAEEEGEHEKHPTPPHSGNQTPPNNTPPPSPKNDPPSSPSHNSQPPSPHNSEDDEMITGNLNEGFPGFMEDPFGASFDFSSDDAPMTKGDFKTLCEKLDALKGTTSQPSSSEPSVDWAKHFETLKTSFEATIENNTTTIQQSKQAISDSDKFIKETTEKVEKLSSDVNTFITTSKAQFEVSTASVSELIKKFSESVQSEKETLAKARESLKKELSDLSTSLKSKFDQLSDDMELNQQVMNTVAIQSEEIKTMKVKLWYAQQTNDEVLNENAAVKASVTEVISYLNRLVTTNDGVFTPSVRNHLALRLQPVLNILNQIMGVSGSGADPKQGGEKASDREKEPEKEQRPPPQKEQVKQKGVSIPGFDRSAEEQRRKEKEAAAQSSGKGKKKIGENDTDEEQDLSEAERLRKIRRQKEIDDLLELTKKLDEQEAAKLTKKLDSEALKLLFGDWSLNRIFEEVFESSKVNKYWLNPAVSFDVSNSEDSQIDFLMTPRAFLFRSFDQIKNIPINDKATSTQLCEFYLKHGKPQYETWSLKKIVGVSVKKALETTPFINIPFKVQRGSKKEHHNFTLADLPTMNPTDWIILYTILATEKDKNQYEPITSHLSRMLVAYIHQVALMDVEVAAVLRKKPIIFASTDPSDSELRKFKIGKINKDPWSMAYHRRKKNEMVKSLFYLQDKHAYTTDALENMISLANGCKSNSPEDRKCFVDMLQWYLVVRDSLKKVASALLHVPIPKPRGQ